MMATYAVMQSPMEHTGHFSQQHRAPLRPMNREQKPKLSLNTTYNHSFGRSPTALCLDTISASSPTTHNTYRNTFDSLFQSEPKETSTARQDPHSTLAHSNDVASHALEPSRGQIKEPTRTSFGPPKEATDSLLASNSLPRTRSILTNGPLTKRHLPIQSPITSSPRQPCSKSPLPIVKRVCFRDPISEEVHTKRFLLRHSDLRSRSSSPSPSFIATDRRADKRSDSREATARTPPPPNARELAPRGHSLTDAEEDEVERGEDQDESNTLPKTPIAGRHKKERQWVWTLGPLPGIKSHGSSASFEASNEDSEGRLRETVAAAPGFSLT